MYVAQLLIVLAAATTQPLSVAEQCRQGAQLCPDQADKCPAAAEVCLHAGRSARSNSKFKAAGLLLARAGGFAEANHMKGEVAREKAMLALDELRLENDKGGVKSLLEPQRKVLRLVARALRFRPGLEFRDWVEIPGTRNLIQCGRILGALKGTTHLSAEELVLKIDDAMDSSQLSNCSRKTIEEVLAGFAIKPPVQDKPGAEPKPKPKPKPDLLTHLKVTKVSTSSSAPPGGPRHKPIVDGSTVLVTPTHAYRGWSYAMFGTGAIAAGLGGVAGATVWRRTKELQTQDQLRDMVYTTNGLYAVAATAAITGAILWLWDSGESK